MTPLLLARTASVRRSSFSLIQSSPLHASSSNHPKPRLLSTSPTPRTAHSRDREALRLSRSASGGGAAARKSEAIAESQSLGHHAYAASPSHAGGSSQGVHATHIADRPSSWSPPDVTPASLVSHLDQYVVGQPRAKKALAVGLFNHYIRLKSHLDRASVREADGEDRAATLPAPGRGKGARASAGSERESTASSSKMGSATAPVQPPTADPQQLAEAAAAAHSDVLSDFVGQTRGSRRGSDGWPVPEGAASSSSQEAGAGKEGRLEPLPYFSSHMPSSAQAAARNLSDRAARALQSADRHLEPTTASHDADRLSSASVAARHGPTLAKSNILLLGPSGSGKTLLISSLARRLNLPFVTVDATPFTQAGYVGEDVETIVQRLLVASGWDAERASMGIVCIDEADKIARRPGDTAAKDVSGEGVQQSLLRMLEGTQITVTDKSQQSQNAASQGQPPSAGPWWPPHQAQSGGQKAGSSRGGSAAAPSKGGSAGAPRASASTQGNTFVVDTTNVLFVLCGAFTGLPDIVRARLEGESPGMSRPEASQTEEASDLYEQVEPEDLNAYGLIPEFLGRIPVLASLRALSEEELLRVLTEPRDALTAQYEALFSAYGVELRFTTLALRSLARQAHAKSTGARALRRLCESRLLEAMYAAPGGAKYALVDEAAVRDPREGAGGQPGEVHLYSRGGRLAFERAWRDEEDEARRRDDEAEKAVAEQRRAEMKARRAKGKAAKVGTALSVSTSKGSSPKASPSPSPSPSSPPTGQGKQTPVSTLFGGAVTEAMLRRRARARLTRPSRVGNLRIVAE